MRVKVKCNNCGIKWVRVTVYGGELESNDDLQYNCPKCGSNDYENQNEVLLKQALTFCGDDGPEVD